MENLQIKKKYSCVNDFYTENLIKINVFSLFCVLRLCKGVLSMILGRVTQHYLDQPGGGMTRPRPSEPVTDARMLLMITPIRFPEFAPYTAMIDNNGRYDFSNVEDRIQNQLDADSDSQIFLRVDVGRNFRKSLYRTIRIDEARIRENSNINIDVFQIAMNREDYITAETILEAIAMPEVVEQALRSVRVAGVRLIPVDVIESILGDFAQRINSIELSILRNQNINIKFSAQDIQFNIGRIARAAIQALSGGRVNIPRQILIDSLEFNLELKMKPSRTINSDDIVDVRFDDVSMRVESNIRTVQNGSSGSVLDADTQAAIRTYISETVAQATLAALSPLSSEILRYLNIEMESKVDEIVDEVISDTITTRRIGSVTKTIEKFNRQSLFENIDGERVFIGYALQPVIQYGLMTEPLSLDLDLPIAS